MKIANQLDAGPMIMKEKVLIAKEDTTEILSKKLSELGSTMISNLLQ